MKNKYRWVIGGMLILSSILNYVDRAALPIVAPLVSKDLGLNPAQLGTIFSAFFLGYAVFCFIGGQAVDRFGPKRVYGWTMALWSLFCGATAIVTGFGQLLVFRVLFGAGEGPMGTVTNKMVSNWFPREEVGLMMGLAPTGGNMLGAAITGPLIGYVALTFGWRASFVIVMMTGFAWVVAWRLLATEKPADHRRVSPAELSLIQAGRPGGAALPTGAVLPLARYLRSPTVIAIGISFFASNYVLYFFLNWMPSYLVDVRHLNIKTMSILTVIPWAVSLVGCVLGGVISDQIILRGGRPLFARKIVIVVGLAAGAVCLALGTLVQTTTMAIVLIALAIVFIITIPAACWALLQETIPANRMGGVGGYVHFLANLSGIIGPAITGFIIQYGGGYNSSFLLAGAVSVVGALVVIIFVRERSDLAALGGSSTVLGSSERH